MTKQLYRMTRQSIRENGMRYTMAQAIHANDVRAAALCDGLADIACKTDWLAMRTRFARITPGAEAFKLTTTT